MGSNDVATSIEDQLTSGPEAGDPGRTVLTRAAAIMNAFGDGERSLTLVDLSARAHLPKSTVHRLAEQLRSVGWLERDHAGYCVGLRVFELGGLAVQRNRLRDAAFPHLHALATTTGLSVQLGVLDGQEVVYLERILVGEYRVPTRLGGRMPAYCTALGKAMLAFDETAAAAVLQSELRRRTDSTITDATLLRTNLRQVRESGVALDLSEACESLGCVSAPIRNSGRAIGAVSVTGPIDRIVWDDMADAVQRAASAIWMTRFGSVRSTARDRTVA